MGAPNVRSGFPLSSGLSTCRLQRGAGGGDGSGEAGDGCDALLLLRCFPCPYKCCRAGSYPTDACGSLSSSHPIINFPHYLESNPCSGGKRCFEWSKQTIDLRVCASIYIIFGQVQFHAGMYIGFNFCIYIYRKLGQNASLFTSKQMQLVMVKKSIVLSNYLPITWMSCDKHPQFYIKQLSSPSQFDNRSSQQKNMPQLTNGYILIKRTPKIHMCHVTQ